MNYRIVNSRRISRGMVIFLVLDSFLHPPPKPMTVLLICLSPSNFSAQQRNSVYPLTLRGLIKIFLYSPYIPDEICMRDGGGYACQLGNALYFQSKVYLRDAVKFLSEAQG